MTLLSKALQAGERTIPVSSSVEKQYGRCAAKLLQQVHFWCSSKRDVVDGEAWVYNTYDAWADQLGYSSRQIRRVAKELVEVKVLVVSNHNKRGYDRTLWYRVAYDELAKQMSAVIPVAAECTLPCVHNDLMDVSTMSAPIPEKNHKMIAQVSSVVPDALEKEQSDLTSTTGSKEPEEGKLIMNAKEILDNPAWKEAQEARLHSLWLKHTGAVMGEYQNGLSIKQMSQLEMFDKSWKDNAPGALVYAVHNWNNFAVAAKAARGLDNAPVWPDIGFMVKYGDVLMSLFVQLIAPVTLDPLPKTSEVVETKPDIYVPQPGDLEKALEMFK